MSIYPEIPSATFRGITQLDINGKPILDEEGLPVTKSYFVRKFGLNGQVFEEELVPMPTEKVIKTFNLKWGNK